MKKRRSWSKLSSKCERSAVCECGENVICENEDNEDGMCEKESCPIWNKGGKTNVENV